MSESQDLLTVSEVAKALAVSEAMVYRLVKDKQLQCIRIGVAIRIPENGLASYVTEHFQDVSVE